MAARPASSDRTDPPNPNPNPNPEPSTVVPLPFTVAGASGDARLSSSSFLSREEVLRRRSRRIRQLERYYRRQYWALAEEIKVKHRDYYWNYGASPIAAGDEKGAAAAPGGEEEEGSGENGRSRCASGGCKSKAMPLTRFCHAHILLDGKQTLYKACGFVIKRFGMQSGPIICGKPVLRSAVPSFCSMHFQKAQKNVSLALKKTGVNICSSSRPTAKFNALLVECIRQIQARRRNALNASAEKFNDSAHNVG